MQLFVWSAAVIMAAGAAMADWVPESGDGIVHFSASSRINDAILLGGCNRLLGPGFTFSLMNYSGGALRTVDDASQPVVLEIASGASIQRSRIAMSYFAPDKGWVLSGMLPVSFLDTLARGDSMTLRNVSGEAVAEFGLTGTAKLRAAMRAGCGF